MQDHSYNANSYCSRKQACSDVLSSVEELVSSVEEIAELSALKGVKRKDMEHNMDYQIENPGDYQQEQCGQEYSYQQAVQRFGEEETDQGYHINDSKTPRVQDSRTQHPEYKNDSRRINSDRIHDQGYPRRLQPLYSLPCSSSAEPSGCVLTNVSATGHSSATGSFASPGFRLQGPPICPDQVRTFSGEPTSYFLPTVLFNGILHKPTQSHSYSTISAVLNRKHMPPSSPSGTYPKSYPL